MTVADLKDGQLFQYFNPSANRWSNKHYVAQVISFEGIESYLVTTLAGRQIALNKNLEIRIH